MHVPPTLGARLRRTPSISGWTRPLLDPPSLRRPVLPTPARTSQVPRHQQAEPDDHRGGPVVVHPALVRRATALLTGALHLVALWLYLSSGLLAPAWAIAALLVLWAVLGWAAVKVHRSHGPLALLVPLAAIGVWFGALTAGEQLLGWTG